MWRILIFLAVASALALGAVWLADRPGEVSIVWMGLSIETTVAVAAIGLGLLVLAGMALWSLLRFVFGLPTAFSFASAARRRSRGFEAVSRGMVAVGAGDPSAARRHASDATKLIAGEPLTLLLNAQAAQLAGDKPAAEAAFKAMLDEPETRVLGLRGLFVEARRRGDETAARAFADEAVRLSPSLAWANDALLEFHTQAGEWAEARTAVERRTALRLIDRAESKRHRAVLLAAEALAREEADPAAALTLALDAAKLAPGLTPSAALAGRLLTARGDLRKAARILEAAWTEQPHPDLARAYTRLRSGDSAGDRLQKAKALMRLKPTDPESAFAVAQAAIEVRDFSEARSALQPLIAATPTVKACLLMAAVEDGEFGAAGRGREWLHRSTRALPDSAWVADGLVSQRWLPVSPVSGRLDAFVWTAPPPAIGGPVIDEGDVPTLAASIDPPSEAPAILPPRTATTTAPTSTAPTTTAAIAATAVVTAPVTTTAAAAAVVGEASGAQPEAASPPPATADVALADQPGASPPAVDNLPWYARRPPRPTPSGIAAQAAAPTAVTVVQANASQPEPSAASSAVAAASGPALSEHSEQPSAPAETQPWYARRPPRRVATDTDVKPMPPPAREPTTRPEPEAGLANESRQLAEPLAPGTPPLAANGAAGSTSSIRQDDAADTLIAPLPDDPGPTEPPTPPKRGLMRLFG
jgi:HemY protein